MGDGQARSCGRYMGQCQVRAVRLIRARFAELMPSVVREYDHYDGRSERLVKDDRSRRWLQRVRAGATSLGPRSVGGTPHLTA